MLARHVSLCEKVINYELFVNEKAVFVIFYQVYCNGNTSILTTKSVIS